MSYGKKVFHKIQQRFMILKKSYIKLVVKEDSPDLYRAFIKTTANFLKLFDIQENSVFCIILDILAKEANVIKVENKTTAIYSICIY